MNTTPEPRYGLPSEMTYCKKCIIPNTKPMSMNEYLHTKDTKHKFIQFDEDGICSACRFNEARDDGTIDWEKREAELKTLCDKYRSTDGSYDCLVPGSGGKDSVMAAHLLKYKYGMHPLTVTWAPHLYTDVGWKNFQNWIHIGGFDNYLFTPNGKLHRLLTRNAFINLLHPFQPFILGQKTFAPKMAARFNIPLIFWGENPGEFGADVSIHEKKFSSSGNEGHSLEFVDPKANLEELYLGGKQVKEYLDEGVSLGELSAYFPLDPRVIEEKKLEFHFLGYYIKWIPQEAYYYAAEHTGFKANEERTEGTYSKYNSIDDKTDPYFYYTTFIKFGFGRAIADAAQEIRNHHITREEGVALAKRFDGEFPKRYYPDFLEYLGLTDREFVEICDSFRDLSIWNKTGDEWKLRFPLS
jgi:N-acetyl sugar amidotransferase